MCKILGKVWKVSPERWASAMSERLCKSCCKSLAFLLGAWKASEKFFTHQGCDFKISPWLKCGELRKERLKNIISFNSFTHTWR